MAAKTYTIKPNDQVLENTIEGVRKRNNLLHDFENEHIFELTAQAASGDYLALLATKLDEIGQELAEKDPDMHLRIDRLVADLLFLHERYNVVKRK